jgi:hypothetical protein
LSSKIKINQNFRNNLNSDLVMLESNDLSNRHPMKKADLTKVIDSGRPTATLVEIAGRSANGGAFSGGALSPLQI